ncbi:hypothetical protein ABID22_002159 [Pontibacter aydingkolensis]|uniref:Uncharacterized protein n=1 Tax=Pontibacter aydingkolensis TaxID=1911536 RepID=A0ABS7CW89_9BACT|nr:hypothetical protein [Pontibacter aydingkolensis]MBW7467772.1 hypothetical protein [Pontibacter aydingkolensis]
MVVQGGAIQLHSQQEGHRFYSVFFEEYGVEERHYLMLDAEVKIILLSGCVIMLVSGVRLITIEDLVFGFSPILYDLD